MRALILLFCLALAPGAFGQVLVGGGPGFAYQTVTGDGVRTRVARITLFYHQMDLPPGSVQPIGLGETLFVLPSKTTGDAAHCAEWVAQVQHDELTWNRASKVYPYLEIDIAPGARPVQVPGLAPISAWRDQDVLCWEAYDFAPPLF